MEEEHREALHSEKREYCWPPNAILPAIDCWDASWKKILKENNSFPALKRIGSAENALDEEVVKEKFGTVGVECPD